MRRFLMAAAATVLVAGSALAVPITYQQPLIPAGAQNVQGVNNQAPGNQDNPVGATYHYFFATAGSAVTINGDREAGHYDMSWWVFEGTFGDTNDFGASFDGGDSGFIAFGDDQDPPNIPGPFGDPRTVFVAPSTGFYTIAVTNFLSGQGGPPNPYNIDIIGNANVPEPASMALFGGLAVVGIAGIRRRMKKA
jgi:hypothetical protein